VTNEEMLACLVCCLCGSVWGATHVLYNDNKGLETVNWPHGLTYIPFQYMTHWKSSCELDACSGSVHPSSTVISTTMSLVPII